MGNLQTDRRVLAALLRVLPSAARYPDEQRAINYLTLWSWLSLLHDDLLAKGMPACQATPKATESTPKLEERWSHQ